MTAPRDRSPDSLVTAYVEPSLASVEAVSAFSLSDAGTLSLTWWITPQEKAVFNRVTGMKDSWADRLGKKNKLRTTFQGK